NCNNVDSSGIAAGVVCDGNNSCDQNKLCCKSGATAAWKCGSEADCAGEPLSLECDNQADCDGAEVCCFSVTPIPPGVTCAFATVSRGICVTSGTCTGKSFVVCDPLHPCPAGICKDRTLQLQGGTRLMR